MLNVDSNDNGEKKSTLTIAKKHLCTCSTLFLYISLPLLWQCETSLMEKMSHVLTKNFVLVFQFVFFFHCHLYYHLAWLLTFSFSHGRHKIFMLFFQCNSSPLFFLSCCSSLLLFFSMSFTISPVTRQKSPLSDLIWYGTKVNLL